MERRLKTLLGRMYVHKYFANGRLTDFSLIADALLISDSSSAQFRKIAFQPSQYVARINSCNQIFAVQNPYITDKASHSFGQLISLDCRLVYTLPVQVSSGILSFHSSTLFRCPAVQNGQCPKQKISKLWQPQIWPDWVPDQTSWKQNWKTN